MGNSTNFRPWTVYEQRLRTPRRVATSLKPTSCWPPPESVQRNENQSQEDRHLKEKALQKTVTQFMDDGFLIDNASWILLRPKEQGSLSPWHKK